MPEYLEVYNLKNKKIGVLERSKFYNQIKAEFKKSGKITKKVKTIRLILMNPDGRIYLQRRSKNKPQNPGLYDKTVGGHVLSGYSWEMTVVKECAEELGFPAVVISDKELKLAVKSTDLSVVGLFRATPIINCFLSKRKDKDIDFVQPLINIWYFGYYDGALRFKDGEAVGLETFSLKELAEEIKNNPQNFTEDMKFALKKYKKYLVPLNKLK